MGEGGTVYYKSSPALEFLGGGGRNVFGSDNFETVDSPKNRTHLKGLWMNRVVDLFRSDNHIENFVVRDMVDTVLESGLLCEEHCSQVTALKDTNRQLSSVEDEDDQSTVQQSLADELMFKDKNTLTKPSINHHAASFLLWHPSFLFASLLAVPFLAFIVTLCGLYNFLLVAMVTFLSVPSCMGLVLLLLKLKRKYVCDQLQQARDKLQRYCSSVDTLLRLITEAVKYLQEMETLSKGYSRPVPLSASGVLWSQRGCYTHCSVLRSTLHSVCTKLTEDVRELILKLKQCSYEEFEKENPISDSLSLSSLKSEIMRPWMEQDDQGSGLLSSTFLSLFFVLDSLQGRCHIFATVNSELLRNFCFEIMMTPLNNSTSDSNPIVMETGIRMRQLMPTLTSSILVGCDKLKWAMTFEDNLCVDNDNEPVTKGGSDDNASDQDNLARDVVVESFQGMDKKGQLVVRKLRDGLQLLLFGEGDREDILLSVKEQLDAVSAHLDGLIRDVADMHDLLDESRRRLSSSPSAEETSFSCEVLVGKQDDPHSSRTHKECRSSESSSDEEVFEMLVPAEDVSSAESELSGGYFNERPSDIPQEMMSELKNVLTIRQVQRNERKKSKRKRNEGGLGLGEDKVHLHSDNICKTAGVNPHVLESQSRMVTANKDIVTGPGCSQTSTVCASLAVESNNCWERCSDVLHCGRECDAEENENETIHNVGIKGNTVISDHSVSEPKFNCNIFSTDTTSKSVTEVTSTVEFPPLGPDARVRHLVVESLATALANCRRPSEQTDTLFGVGSDEEDCSS